MPASSAPLPKPFRAPRVRRAPCLGCRKPSFLSRCPACLAECLVSLLEARAVSLRTTIEGAQGSALHITHACLLAERALEEQPSWWELYEEILTDAQATRVSVAMRSIEQQLAAQGREPIDYAAIAAVIEQQRSGPGRELVRSVRTAKAAA